MPVSRDFQDFPLRIPRFLAEGHSVFFCDCPDFSREMTAFSQDLRISCKDLGGLSTNGTLFHRIFMISNELLGFLRENFLRRVHVLRFSVKTWTFFVDCCHELFSVFAEFVPTL